MKKHLFFLMFVLVLNFVLYGQNISLDASFDPGEGPDASVSALAIQQDGKVLIGGTFDQFNNGPNLTLSAIRLNTDGTLDQSFTPGATEVGGSVYSILIQPDGKLLFIGAQRIAFPANNVGVVRLNENGSLDASFDMQGAGFNNSVIDGVLQTDGKLIVCGDFTQFNGVSQNRIARLNSDGTIDASFNIGTGFNFQVRKLAIQPDGKILVGGLFDEFNGQEHNHIVRLNTDGTLDESFDAGNEFTDDLRNIGLQPDGKILVGGNLKENFPTGVIRPRIARLNNDGSIDTSFDPAAGFNAQPNAFIIQPDGKIIVAGDFTTFDNTTIRGICRLHEDGSLDATFDPGLGFQSSSNPSLAFVNGMALQTDGKIITVGNFETFNGMPRKRIARLIGGPVTASSPNVENHSTIEIYPNPASLNVTVQNLIPNSKLLILNASGMVVYEKKSLSNIEVVDLSNIENGVYFVQIMSDGNKLSSEKIIVVK